MTLREAVNRLNFWNYDAKWESNKMVYSETNSDGDLSRCDEVEAALRQNIGYCRTSKISNTDVYSYYHYVWQTDAETLTLDIVNDKIANTASFRISLEWKYLIPDLIAHLGLSFKDTNSDKYLARKVCFLQDNTGDTKKYLELVKEINKALCDSDITSMSTTHAGPFIRKDMLTETFFWSTTYESLDACIEYDKATNIAYLSLEFTADAD